MKHILESLASRVRKIRNNPDMPNAERILDALRGALDEFPVRLLKTNRSPASLMAGWLATEPEAPFTIDQDCVLKAVTEDKATIRYSLDQRDVRDHLSSGKNPTRLALTKLGGGNVSEGIRKALAAMRDSAPNADEGLTSAV